MQGTPFYDIRLPKTPFNLASNPEYNTWKCFKNLGAHSLKHNALSKLSGLKKAIMQLSNFSCETEKRKQAVTKTVQQQP